MQLALVADLPGRRVRADRKKLIQVHLSNATKFSSPGDMVELKVSEGGAGLGLSICKAIVEKHGDAINFHSKINQGALFRLCGTNE